MNPHLIEFGCAFVAATRSDPFLPLNEGYVKVRAIETALGLGWTLQEGAGSSPTGPVADYVSMANGRPKWIRAGRGLMLGEGSADLAIVLPMLLLIEIKARPDHGTKAQAQFTEMYADVARVATNPNMAFLFVFDQKTYLSFSGEKTERRGRRTKMPSWFQQCFPKLTALAAAGHIEASSHWENRAVTLHFWHQQVSPDVARVICVGARPSDGPA